MTIEMILRPHEKDLGGFVVRRSLPSAQRQSIGPFLFFDHFGPVSFNPPHDHDVRPHPHIGLATVTYLFKGAIVHRDSIGSVQRIEPGAINWMTSGRGIVHSERSPEDLRDETYESHGLQLWVGLPIPHEEAEPSFSHTPATAIPLVNLPGAVIRVLVGRFVHEGVTIESPVLTLASTLYLDIQLLAGASFELPPLEPERGIYSVQGSLEVDGQSLEPYALAVLRAGEPIMITAKENARFVVIGGQPLDGRRFMWWNFVSSSKERIQAAADAWDAQQIGQVPGEHEWIPSPKKRLT
jgi:redox-sensitive bicupin YhaK (pirin superfamily)